MNGPGFVHENLRMGRRLSSGARPVDGSTAFRLCGCGWDKKDGKGRERPLLPLLPPAMLYRGKGRYVSAGGAGGGQSFSLPTISASSIYMKHLSLKYNLKLLRDMEDLPVQRKLNRYQPTYSSNMNLNRSQRLVRNESAS